MAFITQMGDVYDIEVKSHKPCQVRGIKCMRNPGVIISSIEGTFYEWQRTVQCGNRTFGDNYTSRHPKGIYL